ncbi:MULTISPECIES: type II secretion system protein J [unclassified Nostoc]|uniref:PulJ/GspJ family protein n=1 Tax=unclassified Nostoc TaxID=2593658 RepID=UPI002AD46062|nr:prepilin-type N-terminal cleavage/methylation domain-containing protein [Nostoc sp. DedQUE03]MDZ7972830.1 prepilin-type N-terminal cleavage/methylation domain-containing protein [Nostoc sp. DedQUE03]MDZ8045248.1 prepilin-type N-terminal cleavage/methylation domain-containing protein [Nostoc sp. DedQUE02]
MTKRHLKLLLNWLWVYSKKSQTAGFTLIELLVALLIASLIISALLSLVVDLLQVDSRENARNETQQEMKTALNYMAAELREAVYVYDNNCMSTTVQGTAPTASATASSDYCPGLQNYLPTSLITTTQKPVLAFWKPEVIDDATLTTLGTCSGITDATKNQDCLDLLIKRRTYTLVVYLQSTTSGSSWRGKSRIIRYALSKYSAISASDLTQSTGYVDPSQTDSTSFQIWPRKSSDGTNLQASLPSTSGVNPAALVDFVDAPDATNTGTLPTCGTNYIRTPSSSTSNSFFACVRTAVPASGSTAVASGVNQDVVIYLRGNANGKTGVTTNSYTPILQTQVLMRGVINKIPES